MLSNLFIHPILKEFVRLWLKAKILDAVTFTGPTSGTPQWGINYPSLGGGVEDTVYKFNHPIITSKFISLKNGRNLTTLSIGFANVRYADDFIVFANIKNILTKYIRRAIDKFLGLFLSTVPHKMFTLRDKNAHMDFQIQNGR